MSQASITHLATDNTMASCDNLWYHYRSRPHDRPFIPRVWRDARLAAEDACHDCFRIQTRVSTSWTWTVPILTWFSVVGFSITHLRRLSRTVDAEDKGFSFISPAIWIQIWLAWSLVSASIPSFRAFMNPFDNISVAKTDDSHSASRSELNGAYLMMGPISKPSHRNHGASARSASQGM